MNATSNFEYLTATPAGDTLKGATGNDIILGNKGNDLIKGNQGKDKSNGGQGNDTLYGGQGDDIIRGGQGNDLIFGGSGNDTLYGDQGSNTLNGGAGNDIFAIGRGTGGVTISTADYITDFGNGNDKIRLLDGLSFSDLKFFPDPNNNNNTVIQDQVTGEYLVVLTGVNSNSLTPNKFEAFHSGKIINDWNAILLDAVRTDSTAPPVAARNMAMVHTSIYDAINSITQGHSPYKVNIPVSSNTSLEAATASASHQILINLYPKQKDKFDAAFTASLAKIPDGQGKLDGIQLGETVANQMLALRANDGSQNIVSYTPENIPGHWQPTAPNYANSLLPQWPKVTPFAIQSPTQFQPPGPPVLNSAEYASEVNLVKAIGQKDSQTRTTDQTAIANFWGDGAGTCTPPGHWNQIAEEVSTLTQTSLEDTARLFSLLNMALADAGIVAWDCKYKYDFWRPITAIRNANQDGNLDTMADPNWEPLLTTPPFSEYVSGHSTFSGAGATILSSFFGNDFGFADAGDRALYPSRTYNNFDQAANEAGMSRIYGGIHFPAANQDGLIAGKNLGTYLVQNFLI